MTEALLALDRGEAVEPIDMTDHGDVVIGPLFPTKFVSQCPNCTLSVARGASMAFVKQGDSKQWWCGVCSVALRVSLG